MQLTAKIEPFDSFWEAPANIEKGYDSFHRFYRSNYLKYMPAERQSRILVISCGPGYFVSLLNDSGYPNVQGIDSDQRKIDYARKRNLDCRVEKAFDFLETNGETFDVIVAEQELNHLTKEEILEFLGLCHRNLKDGGTLLVHSLNGANPITGAEALAQNFDHFNSFTESSLRQVLELTNYQNIHVFPLNLYVFYHNPLNYIGMFLTGSLSAAFRICFMLYGKSNRLFSKKIAAVCRKKA